VPVLQDDGKSEFFERYVMKKPLLSLRVVRAFCKVEASACLRAEHIEGTYFLEVSQKTGYRRCAAAMAQKDRHII
jgi:hypothetical protein